APRLLAMNDASEKNSRIANDEASGLRYEQESRLGDPRKESASERLEIHRQLVLVRYGESTSDVEITNVARAERAHLVVKLEEAHEAVQIWLELEYLRADVHVQPEQRDVRPRERDARCVDRLVVRNSELVAAFARARVVVRRIHVHFWIHTQRHRSAESHVAGDRVQLLELENRLDVEQQNAGGQRLSDLLRQLP